MTTITLPPLPEPVYTFDEDGNKVFYEKAALVRARDLEVARLVLEAAAKNCDDAAIRLFSGKSRVNQVDRHVAEVLRDKAKAIRALEVKHYE